MKAEHIGRLLHCPLAYPKQYHSNKQTACHCKGSSLLLVCTGEQEEHWNSCWLCPFLWEGLCDGCAGHGERAVRCKHYTHL